MPVSAINGPAPAGSRVRGCDATDRESVRSFSGEVTKPPCSTPCDCEPTDNQYRDRCETALRQRLIQSTM